MLAAICAYAVAVAPAGANASPGWTAPANFSLPSGAQPGILRIAYQTGGTATVAYIELVSPTPPIQTVLHVGVIPPGGGYQGAASDRLDLDLDSCGHSARRGTGRCRGRRMGGVAGQQRQHIAVYVLR